MFYSGAAVAAQECFVAKENGKALKDEGDCNARHTPGCDFSIAISLMGFDSGILQDENHPQWDYKEGYETYLNFWKKPHKPRTWILDSCVWYTGNIVERLGTDKIADYIHQFKYGNEDVTGINRTDWPGAVLISANEQVDFLQRFMQRKLGVSAKAYLMTEKIFFIQDMFAEWNLYGKTGVGEGPGDKRIGWFTGWLAKGERRIPFASVVVHPQKQDTIASFSAKNNAMTSLFWLINELEK